MTPGVCEAVGVNVCVGVRDGVRVRVAVGVGEAVDVEAGVDVGRAVGASPCRRNCPTTFQFSPAKIWTWYVPGSHSDAGASHSVNP